MKQVLLVILVIGLGLNAVWAQEGHKKRHKHPQKLNKEARAALQKFHKEEVYPIKKAAHDQFLAALKQEDRDFLAQKRIEEKALHTEMRLLHKEMRTYKETGKSRDEIRAMRQSKLEPLREKRKALMESMKPFMERNKDLIKESMEPMKANHEAWKAKKEAILDKYLSEAEQAKRKECKEERKKGGAHKTSEGHPRKGKRAVRFVLWDGEMKAPKERKGNTSINSKTNIEEVQQQGFTLNTYPNPAISQTTILLNLAETSTKVKVSLTNTEGQQVWSKNYNKLAAGEHQIDVNLQKVASGQYFCTVEVGEERMTKPLVVNK